MKNLTISDPHFGHENIITYCDRPFSNAEEMDEILAFNWNSVVKPEDTVYMLGDWAFGHGSREILEKILPTLNGTIIMIRGNHDNKPAEWYKKLGVAEVHGGVFWVYKPNVILSHEPYPTKNPVINIHGHTHNLMHVGPSNIYINVSAEAINYTPVDLDELIKNHRCQQYGS
jgi:calcineurin-like phosphoesterase family protein